MRKKLYEIIAPSRRTSLWSTLYDYFMIVVITASIIPLAVKQDPPFFAVLDDVCVSIFIVDYILRLCTADFLFGKKSASSFLRYPFSLMAIIDLLSILPSVVLLNEGFKLLRIFRLVRALRVFRIFRVLRYSKTFRIILTVFKKQKDALLAVLTLAIAYIIISALVVYNVEPETFATFYDAVYWSTISLTTVGYGDIYPVTTVGRTVAMVSSLFGIAIIALPSGIITAGYMRELEKHNPKTGEAKPDAADETKE